jgi:phosphate transport system substrate-binding protein
LKGILKKSVFPLMSGLLVLGMLSGCGSKPSLSGSGATFPEPLYKTWIAEYGKLTGITITYDGVGSGTGVTNFINKLHDFGASDGIPTEKNFEDARKAGGDLVTIPMTAAAVAVIYNISGVSTGLQLTGAVLADIYLGKIKKWNDTAITVLNPGVNLPDADIVVVHRSDSSGTTNIFTNYLVKVSSQWASGPKSGNSVEWPVGIGAEGSGQMVTEVKSKSNSIAYVDLAYAIRDNMTYAQLLNSSGKYVSPSVDSATAAANGVTLPDNMQVMVTNSSDPNAYPIVGFTWILAWVNQTDKDKGQALVDFLWWAIHDGQSYCAGQYYAKLSSAAVAKAEALIKSIKYDGKALIN